MVAFRHPTTVSVGAMNVPGVGRLADHLGSRHVRRLPDGVDPDDLAGLAPAKRPPIVDVPAATPLVDSVLGKTSSALGTAGNIAFLGVPVVGLAGRATGWLGTKTGLGPLTKAGGKVKAAVAYVNETPWSALENTRAGGMAFRATQSTFNGAAGMAQRISDWTGLGIRMQARHAGKAHYHFSNAAAVAGMDAAVHDSLRPHMAGIREILSVPSAAHVDIKKLEAAHADLAVAIKKLGEEKGAVGTTRAAKKAVARLEKNVGNLLRSHHGAEAWKNPAEAIRALPNEMKKNTLRHGVMDASFIGLAGISVIATFRDFLRKWKELKHMHADVTGVDPKQVSTLTLLLGNVSSPVAAARSHLIKTLFAREAIETAGLAINVKMAGRGGHVSPLLLGGQFAGSLGIDSYMGESIVPLYHELNDMHKREGKLPAEAYTAFIGIASRDLKERGGADSMFAREVGRQYAAENKSLSQVLKEIDDGMLMVRVHKIIEANEAAKHASAASVSHVDRLNKNAAPHREIVGKHTENVSREAIPGQGMSPA